ncbi:MAG: hypothetical protein AB8B69_24755 [Chitinophagales bacterium]
MTQTKFILLSLLIVLFLVKVKTVQAQTDDSLSKIEETTLTKKEKRKQIPKYYGIGIGMSSSTFRDFATSPLFYNGAPIQIALSRLKVGDNRETEMGLSYNLGAYFTDFNDNPTGSSVHRVGLNYSQLYKISLFNSESINTKIGFLLNGTANQRENNALGNNAIGVDVFANLMGSIKITKDISRKAAKEKKFLFWKYKQKEKKRNLAFRLNLGLVNSSYRNGYIYTNHTPVLNGEETFDGYEFKILSGFRASSRVDYTRYLKNKNAVQFSYVWDAYSTGGDLDKFEMAHHTLRFTLLFNTNNK